MTSLSKFSKNILFVLLFLTLSNFLHSRILNQAEIEKVALKYIENENLIQKTHLINNEYIFQGISDLLYKDKKIGYVIDLMPIGFMIMPKISELSPVKFISLSEDYHNLENNFLIEAIKFRIHYTIEKLGYFRDANPDELDDGSIDKNQKLNNENVWNKTLSNEVMVLSEILKEDILPLLISKWNQDDPYNLYTPILDDEKTVTGCAATAIAQVMYFWKYPTTGQDHHEYLWNGIRQKADFNHEYFWSRMLDQYVGVGNYIQKDAVARLMSDIGISIDMKYGLESSAEFDTNNALVNYFKYDPEIHKIFRHNYANWDEWFVIFKNQINNGWPVLYGMFPPDGPPGHGVVLDGYRIENGINQIHVNMGYGGAYDNYYTMDDIHDYGNEQIDYAFIDIYPIINLNAPNGHEQWEAGSVHSINWKANESINYVKIEYSIDAGINWIVITEMTTNDGNHPWTIPSSLSDACLIKVSSYSNPQLFDISNIKFSIINGASSSISIQTPNGGEVWQTGTTHSIAWTKVGLTGNVSIDLFKGSSLCQNIGSVSASSGSYNWLVPSDLVNGNDYKIRIFQGSIEDFSNNYFSLSTCPMPLAFSLSSPGKYGFPKFTFQPHPLFGTSR